MLRSRLPRLRAVLASRRHAVVSLMRCGLTLAGLRGNQQGRRVTSAAAFPCSPLRGTGPLYTPLTLASSHFRNFFLFFRKHIDSEFLADCIATRCNDTFLFLLVAFLLRPGLLLRVQGRERCGLLPHRHVLRGLRRLHNKKFSRA